jgi:hypothetical protein
MILKLLNLNLNPLELIKADINSPIPIPPNTCSGISMRGIEMYKPSIAKICPIRTMQRIISDQMYVTTKQLYVRNQEKEKACL